MNISGHALSQPSQASKLNYKGKTHDYVPLFTVAMPIIQRNYANIGRGLYREHASHLASSRLPVLQILHEKAVELGVDEFSFHKDLVERFEEAIKEWVNDNNYEFTAGTQGWGGSNYEDLIHCFTRKNVWQRIDLRNKNYLTNLWYLAELKDNRETTNIKTIRTLATVMVKREMLPYIRMCYLLNEDIHPDALELWVDEDVDVAKGEYKNLRPKYRKHIKNEVLEMGVEIKEFANLDQYIYSVPQPPKFKKISERKEWYLDFSKLFLSSREEIKQLKENHNIELVM